MIGWTLRRMEMLGKSSLSGRCYGRRDEKDINVAIVGQEKGDHHRVRYYSRKHTSITNSRYRQEVDCTVELSIRTSDRTSHARRYTSSFQIRFLKCRKRIS